MPQRRRKSGEERLENRAVLEQLERILASEDFDASPRSRDFVRFIVEETLAGRADALTQSAIATRVFERREDFDPTVDPIVRIQAGRLRRSLERYYLLSGGKDAVRIELPRGAYVPVARWAVPTEVKLPEAPAVRHAPTADGWPSIVVSLFEPHPSGPEASQAAERLNNDLCVEMGHYGDVHVVRRRELDALGQTSAEAADFALSGQISSGDEGWRVSARLMDSGDARQIWAEVYNSEPGASDAFMAQTARVIAARVASEQGVVAQRLWAEQRERPLDEITPYGAILLSYQFFFNRNAKELAPAVLALERTVRERPECQLAWVQLARLHSANYSFEIADAPTSIEQSISCAQQAVRLDPSSQRASVALAGAFLVKGELSAGRREAERAYDLNPDSFIYLEWIGWLITLLGDWERGPAIVRRALARNPHHIPVAQHALWADHMRRGQIEEAYEAALRYQDATFFWRSLMRASCLGHLGRRAEAKLEIAELLRKKPHFARRGRTLIGRHIKFPDLLEQVVRGPAQGGAQARVVEPSAH